MAVRQHMYPNLRGFCVPPKHVGSIIHSSLQALGVLSTKYSHILEHDKLPAKLSTYVI